MPAKVIEITVFSPKTDKFVIDRDLDVPSAASIDDVDRKAANHSERDSNSLEDTFEKILVQRY